MAELYLNGRFMSLEEGRVPVEDRGFQFGDGVYEVIHVYNGRPFRMRQHLARLERSLAGIEIPLPEPLPAIEEVCRRVAGTLSHAAIYLQVTRGTAPRSHAFPRQAGPTFLAYARASQPAPAGKTLTLLSVLDDRWGRCNLKTICLLSNVLARQKAVQAGCDEALFVREDGAVTEGAASNAFLVRGGAVVTHPANHRILNGVTREAVIHLARQEGVPVLEQAFTLQEALAGDEFFMTGTTTEVGAVAAIDGRRIDPGTPGPVTLRLKAAFDALVKQECG